jgi:hypothetical protein
MLLLSFETDTVHERVTPTVITKEYLRFCPTPVNVQFQLISSQATWHFVTDSMGYQLQGVAAGRRSQVRCA